MVLLDTNVIIDAHRGAGNDRLRAMNLISLAVTGSGAAINCVTLAELYAGPRRGEDIEEDMRRAGVAILDVPIATAAICGRAYRRDWRPSRARGGGAAAPPPFHTFFIRTRAGLMGVEVVSRVVCGFTTYFSLVERIVSGS